MGRVTKKGLEQPVGSPAINKVPRKMILKEAEEICSRTGYKGGLLLTVSVPGGAEVGPGPLTTAGDPGGDFHSWHLGDCRAYE